MNSRKVLPVLWVLMLPAVVEAQFDFTTNQGTLTITAYTGSGGDVTIPETTNGLAVTAIGTNTFYGLSSLTEVTIPKSVASIGALAFFLCTNLTAVTIGGGVTSIGNLGFGRCYSLAGAYFRGNAPSLGLSVFGGDNNATVYYLPGTIGWDDFAANTGLSTARWLLPNPVILSTGPGFGVQTNRFGFTISWATNLPVVVEASISLTDLSWSPLETNTLVNGVAYFSDPQWTKYPARFYRVRSP